MVQTETRLRFEMEIDAVQASRLEDLLEKLGVERWLVLPGQSGRTPEGRWNRTGQISPSGRRILVLMTLKDEVADRIRPELQAALAQLKGDMVVFPVTVT